MTESTKIISKVMHLRVSEDMHERISEYAARTHRSLNGAAIALMEAALDEDAAKTERAARP